MTEKIRYVVQDFGGWFNMWMDRENYGSNKWYDTLEEAKENLKTVEYQKTRIIKRVITEEILVEKTNAAPKPKFKVGDTVRSEGQKNGYLIIKEVVADSYWTDGYRWNYKVEAVDCKLHDEEGSWREYELRPYTLGGVKPKSHMSIVALDYACGKHDLTKGQVYSVRKIWADGKVEIEDDEEDIVCLTSNQYRLTI